MSREKTVERISNIISLYHPDFLNLKDLAEMVLQEVESLDKEK